MYLFLEALLLYLCVKIEKFVNNSCLRIYSKNKWKQYANTCD